MQPEQSTKLWKYSKWWTMILLMILPCGLAWSQDISKEKGNAIPVPLWQRLNHLSHAEKTNALIQMEIPITVDSSLLVEMSAIENSWNSGDFARSMRDLRCIEEAGFTNLAVCINWKQPRPATTGRWSSDQQVETRGNARQTCLDFDDGSGNLFVVVRRDDGSANNEWSISISNDSGETWSETSRLVSGYNIPDIDAAVVDGWLYIGYVSTIYSPTFESIVRMRRAYTSSGLFDSSYGYQTAIDGGGNEIYEVAVATDEDETADRLYCVAITEQSPFADDNLLCCSSDSNGLTWFAEPTGIYDASHGLDASWNESPAEVALVASYVNNQYTLNVGFLSISGWSFVRDLDFNLTQGTSVSAYQDHIIVVYEWVVGSDNRIKYQISHDGGASWISSYIALTGTNRLPDVTARRGCGIAVTWLEEAGAFDPAWFTRRSYSGTWTPPVTYNEVDAVTVYNMSIEWLPPIPGSADAFGCSWMGAISGEQYAMFDRTTFTLAVAPDPLISGSSATFTVSDAKIECETWIIYSLVGPGSVYFAPLNVTLGINAPRRAVGPVETNEVGGQDIPVTIPPAAAGLDIWFQAVQEENMSNVIATSIL